MNSSHTLKSGHNTVNTTRSRRLSAPHTHTDTHRHTHTHTHTHPVEIFSARADWPRVKISFSGTRSSGSEEICANHHHINQRVGKQEYIQTTSSSVWQASSQPSGSRLCCVLCKHFHLLSVWLAVCLCIWFCFVYLWMFFCASNSQSRRPFVFRLYRLSVPFSWTGYLSNAWQKHSLTWRIYWLDFGSQK